MLKSLLAIFRPKPAPDFARLKPLCNGEATGLQCQHYFPTGHLSGDYKGKLADGTIVELEDDPEFRRRRQCILVSPPMDLDKNVRAYCPQYVASKNHFDPDFEVPPPKELNLPSMIAGGMIPSATDLVHLSEAPTNNAVVKDWDTAPGAPLRGGSRVVVDPEATAVAQAMENEAAASEGRPPNVVAPSVITVPLRGFVHAEVASGKTACSMKVGDRLVAKMEQRNDGHQVEPRLMQAMLTVSCPGCLSLIAERPEVITIIKDRLAQVADFEAAKAAPKTTYDPSITQHAEVQPGVAACGLNVGGPFVRLGPPFIDGMVSPSIQPPTCSICRSLVKSDQAALKNATDLALSNEDPTFTGDPNG